MILYHEKRTITHVIALTANVGIAVILPTPLPPPIAAPTDASADTPSPASASSCCSPLNSMSYSSFSSSVRGLRKAHRQQATSPYRSFGASTLICAVEDPFWWLDLLGTIMNILYTIRESANPIAMAQSSVQLDGSPVTVSLRT